MNKGFFGRRKSDWVFPIGLVLLVGLALGWTIDNRAKNVEIERLNLALQSALKLSERSAPTPN